MTLSRWLRDYVYIPLGGNRKGRLLTYRNLLLTMLLGGLWHGAGWTFVAWGGLHGAGLAFERWKAERGRPARAPGRAGRIVRRLLVFHVVCLAWIFFRASTFGDAWAMIEGLFVRWGEPAPLVGTRVVLAILVGIASQYLPAPVPHAVMSRLAALPPAPPAEILAVFRLAINALGPQGVSPFIYFQF